MKQSFNFKCVPKQEFGNELNFIKNFNMKIKILYFGMTADITGKDYEVIENISDSDSLSTFLFNKYPRLKNISFRIAVNRIVTDSATVFKDGDEAALLPPFAGG